MLEEPSDSLRRRLPPEFRSHCTKKNNDGQSHSSFFVNVRQPIEHGSGKHRRHWNAPIDLPRLIPFITKRDGTSHQDYSCRNVGHHNAPLSLRTKSFSPNGAPPAMVVCRV